MLDLLVIFVPLDWTQTLPTAFVSAFGLSLFLSGTGAKLLDSVKFQHEPTFGEQAALSRPRNMSVGFYFDDLQAHGVKHHGR